MAGKDARWSKSPCPWSRGGKEQQCRFPIAHRVVMPVRIDHENTAVRRI